MAGPRTSRRTARRRRGRILLLGVLVLVGFLYYRPIGSYLGTRDDLARRRAEVKELTARANALEKKAHLVETGENIVRRARRLGMVKQGERLFIVTGISAWRQARRAAGP